MDASSWRRKGEQHRPQLTLAEVCVKSNQELQVRPLHREQAIRSDEAGNLARNANSFDAQESSEKKFRISFPGQGDANFANFRIAISVGSTKAVQSS